MRKESSQPLSLQNCTHTTARETKSSAGEITTRLKILKLQREESDGAESLCAASTIDLLFTSTSSGVWRHTHGTAGGSARRREFWISHARALGLCEPGWGGRPRASSGPLRRRRRPATRELRKRPDGARELRSSAASRPCASSTGRARALRTRQAGRPYAS